MEDVIFLHTATSLLQETLLGDNNYRANDQTPQNEPVVSLVCCVKVCSAADEVYHHIGMHAHCL